MKYNFPKNFLGGAAFSGPQTEGYNNLNLGNKGLSIGDYGFKAEPSSFFDETNVNNNFYQKYQADIKLAAEIGFNSLRTSIQGSRLIPDGKNVNPEAVAFYRQVGQTMLDNKIQPIVNLHHFDLPLGAQEIGGGENKTVIDAFVFYAQKCFELFSNQVKMGSTFNEPIVTVEAGYLYQGHYPKIVNMQKAMQVQGNSLLAHIKTVAAFKALKLVDSTIGIILNITPAIARSNSKADLQAAEYAQLFQSECYLEPILKHAYPEKLLQLAEKYNFMGETTQAEFDLIADKTTTIDFLGINYYSPLRVQSLDKAVDFFDKDLTPHYFFQPYHMPNARINPYRGGEIYPEGIYLALKMVQEKYDNFPVFIAENGMGVENESRFEKNKQIADQYRIDFFHEHLQGVHKAISEGSSCFGFHIGTLVDNGSGCNAYKNRYGVIALDLATNERSKKQSSNFFHDVILNNAIEDQK